MMDANEQMERTFLCWPHTLTHHKTENNAAWNFIASAPWSFAFALPCNARFSLNSCWLAFHGDLGKSRPGTTGFANLDRLVAVFHPATDDHSRQSRSGNARSTDFRERERKRKRGRGGRERERERNHSSVWQCLLQLLAESNVLFSFWTFWINPDNFTQSLFEGEGLDFDDVWRNQRLVCLLRQGDVHWAI